MFSSLTGRVGSFVKNESGDAVNWLVVIIIGIALAVGAYVVFKDMPGNIGQGINDAGENAKEGLDTIRYQ